MHVILGTTTVDLFARSEERFPVWGGEHFQASNLAWCRDPLQMVLGGNGANSACVLARLGARVRLISAVGDDTLGALAADWVAAAGVECSALERSATHATATTVVASDIRRQRLIFHHPGAYIALTPDQVLLHLNEKADENAVFYLTSWPLLDGLRPFYANLLAAAHAAGYKTVADIGPAIGSPVRYDELAPLLPLIDLLLANDHELSVCLEPEPDSDVPAPWADPAAHAMTLLEAGARAVILKMGEGGSTVYRRRDPNDEEARTEILAHHMPAFAVPTAQTVGAGDAYAAGLVHALGTGRPLVESMEWASAVAALTVAAGSTLASPYVEEVERLIHSGAYTPAG